MKRTDPFSLDGRAALVTGGGGILGTRMCHGLAERGARIAVVDIDEERSTALADELRTAHGTAAVGIGADVSDPNQVAAMVERAEEELGPLRVLVNNAATKTSDLAAFFAPFEEYSLATWREVTAVNLDGMFLAAQAAGRAMLAHGRGGSIVQTSSIYGLVAADPRIYEGSEYLGRPINTPAVYAASKAAIVGLTRHLAAHWGARDIRVNAIAPGGVESGQNDTFRDRYAARVPMGRMGRQDEVVGAVLFFASDAAAYVTGQVLAIDGGLTAW